MMKTAKLVTGILCIVFTVMVLFQSCAVGVYNSVEENEDLGGAAGFVVAILMLSGGIVSIATRKAEGKGGPIVAIILFALAAVTGLTNNKVYEDLLVWGIWCAIMAVLNIIGLLVKKKKA